MADSKCMTDRQISTFVFLDFETTGLLIDRPRITELSLLAVHRMDLLAGSDAPFPRTVNKLTLCLNPQKQIGKVASQITGLCNYNLKLQKPFGKDTVRLINSFLKRLQSPICLVAHNGNRFDFPLLVTELMRIDKSLDEMLLCADSLEAFRAIDGLEPKRTSTELGNPDYQTPDKPIPGSLKRRHTGGTEHSHKVLKTDFPSTAGEKLRKRWSFETSTSSVFTTGTPAPKMKSYTSYKLGEIYLRLHGCLPLDAHKAEGDCVTMVRCVQRTKGFLEWVDRNAVLFSSIQPGY